MRVLILSMLLLVSCAKQVRVEPPISAYDQALYAKHMVTCAQLTTHSEGDSPDCELIVASYERAQTHYSEVNPKAANIRMAMFSFHRPPREYNERMVPLHKLGPDLVQGYYEPIILYISYAHERVVYCEALHGIAHVLGDPTFAEIGHATNNDPLNFNCAELVAWEYLTYGNP